MSFRTGMASPGETSSEDDAGMDETGTDETGTDDAGPQAPPPDQPQEPLPARFRAMLADGRLGTRSIRLGALAVVLALAVVVVLVVSGAFKPATSLIAPGPLPTTFPVPAFATPAVSGEKLSLPATIDATGSADASPGLLAFIASVPDGSTIVFAAGGTYRLNHGLAITNRHNLVFEGNGATLRSYGSGSVVTDSPFSLDDGDSGITIRDFSLVGSNPDSGAAIYHSGAENQMGIATYGASNVEIANVSISHSWGDCLYIAGPRNGSDAIWSDTIWFHDSTCSQAGRDGVAIVAGSHVTIENDHFDTLGMHVLDIEPDTAKGGGTYVTFRTNTVGIYGLGSVYTGYFFAADGAVGSIVHDVTVTGNTVAGNPHDGYDGSIRGLSTTVEVSRRGNIIFTNNSSGQTIGGPVLLFAHVDGLTVSGNSEPLSRGSLTSISDSTSVHSQ